MITIYFLHDTLTPDNARASMQADAVPPVGAIVRLTGAGLGGAEAWWRIVGQEWKWVPEFPGTPRRPGYWSVIVRCTDDTSER